VLESDLDQPVTAYTAVDESGDDFAGNIKIAIKKDYAA
jgi:hypothetical protein